MVFRVVTWIITVIIGVVRALCPRCANTLPKACFRLYLRVFHFIRVLGRGGGGFPMDWYTTLLPMTKMSLWYTSKFI